MIYITAMAQYIYQTVLYAKNPRIELQEFSPCIQHPWKEQFKSPTNSLKES